ncbi:type II toxin-antitoxin system PemK/MazF family toxin [Roseospira visakhapatnamensis]|uniref:mRNA interferase MazF n=1 Tax=Roseospira visakhapatnamensis TaxID=390880 RepID=A0A7W6RGG8_9PROT|nr:type II toxin-antitoxin system PemK/MazF family toxin [Roseospira visakhapatnamensis]MBB4268012.1 mRNA interferase MazF [Roseospira visakhapatnamensis]
MPVFERWDVVKVPYPYTNRPVTEHRPALVAAVIEEGPGLLWVVMITSAANRAWPGDVPIVDPGAAGLPAPSVIRTAKITTIDAALASRLGTLPDAERHPVRTSLARRLVE